MRCALYYDEGFLLASFLSDNEDPPIETVKVIEVPVSDEIREFVRTASREISADLDTLLSEVSSAAWEEGKEHEKKWNPPFMMG